MEERDRYSPMPKDEIPPVHP